MDKYSVAIISKAEKEFVKLPEPARVKISKQTSMGIDIEYKQPFIPLVDQTRRKPKLIIPLRICFTKSFKVDYSTFWH